MLPSKKWQAKLLETATRSLWSRIFVAIMCTIPYGHQSLTKSCPSRESYYDRFAVVALKGGEVVGHVP